MATLKKQKSGTIMGFIVGLITGLVIAVIVALMVTKTPIPFASRKDSSGNAPIPATTTHPPAGDPNQSLYSKDTPKPAISAPIADNTATTPERPMSATTLQTQQPAAVTEDKTLYYLQAGAFKNRNEAENMRGNLALLGFESHISEGTSNSGILYRVRLGPFRNEVLNKTQSRLKQNGISTTITTLVKQ